MVKLKIVFASVLLTFLSGCNPEPVATSESASTTASTDAENSASPADAPPAGASDSLLPPGVTITVPSKQRSMHGYTTKAGQDRRVVIYEFFDGDVATVTGSLERSMAAAGFNSKPVDDKGDGKTRVAFIKPGFGRVNIAVTSSLGNKPSDASAKGVFSLDVPLVDTAPGASD